MSRDFLGDIFWNQFHRHHQNQRRTDRAKFVRILAEPELGKGVEKRPLGDAATAKNLFVPILVSKYTIRKEFMRGKPPFLKQEWMS